MGRCSVNGKFYFMIRHDILLEIEPEMLLKVRRGEVLVELEDE